MRKDNQYTLMPIKMNLMLKLSDKDVEAVAIKMLQQPITNSLETNKWIDRKSLQEIIFKNQWERQNWKMQQQK